MENNYLSAPEVWKDGVRKAYYSFVGAAFLGILAAIFSFIPLVGIVLNIVVGVLMIVCYVFFILGLKNMKSSVINQDDAAAINNIYTGTIISIVAVVLSLIPVINIVGGILAIVAFVMMLLGFYRMSKSVSLPLAAKSGAFLLYVSMIVDVAGSILGFIPVAGLVIEAIAAVAVFVLCLMGWKKIADSEL